jgi:5-methylcytosine-specific restriction endonuclease McrA
MEFSVKIKRVRRRRKVSPYRRLCVAYKQSYKCALCTALLPPAFQIDHIIDLQDHGEDVETNMQVWHHTHTHTHTHMSILFFLKKRRSVQIAMQRRRRVEVKFLT